MERVDRRVVRCADLEMQVRYGELGVAAVAHVADHFTGADPAAEGQSRRHLPFVSGEPVSVPGVSSLTWK